MMLETCFNSVSLTVFLLFSRASLASLGLQATEAMKAHLDQKWVLQDTNMHRDCFKASRSQKHTQNVLTRSKCVQQTCRVSYVSGLIINFISQGPKGPRGIKGAPGDRGQIGGRVSVGGTCGPSIIFSGSHEVSVYVCVYLDLQVFLFLYFREKMEPQETVLPVVMVSRYELIVVHVCHVHMTLYSKDLCLF